MYLCIYVSMYLIYLCIYVSMYLCIYAYVFNCIYVCVCASLCMSFSTSVTVSVYLPVGMTQHIYVHLNICVCVCFFDSQSVEAVLQLLICIYRIALLTYTSLFCYLSYKYFQAHLFSPFIITSHTTHNTHQTKPFGNERDLIARVFPRKLILQRQCGPLGVREESRRRRRRRRRSSE